MLVIIIVVVAVVLVLGAAIAYMMMARQSQAETDVTTQVDATPGVTPTANPAFQSHFVQPENDVQPEGAVYMKNGIWLDENGNEVS